MESYSWSYKLLHWLMTILICLMFMAFQGFQPDTSDADRIEMLMGHSSIGSFITLLIIIRLTKRFVLKHQQPQHKLPARQAKAAKSTHYGLYLLMVLVPATGYLTANFHHLPVQLLGSIPLNGSADAELFTTLKLVHVTLVQLLMALVILHIGAALAHKLVLKDKVLASMRPWFAAK